MANAETVTLKMLAAHSASRPPPEVLWHYCSAQTLLNVLTKPSVWSSHYTCLNDSDELSGGYFRLILEIDIMGSELRGTLGSVPETHEMIQSVRRLLCGEITPELKRYPHGHPEGYLGENYECFVACFSESKDDVSQWRMYGGGEGGFALGFESKTLAAPIGLPPKTKSAFVPVIYDAEQQRIFLRDFINAMITDFEQAVVASGATGASASPHNHAREWLSAFSYLAPILKDRSFATEQEWRIIVWVDRDDISYLKNAVQFLARPTVLSRHLPLHFDPFPLRRIMVGPTRLLESSKRSVSLLLLKCGIAAEVELAKTPFRVV